MAVDPSVTAAPFAKDTAGLVHDIVVCVGVFLWIDLLGSNEVCSLRRVR